MGFIATLSTVKTLFKHKNSHTRNGKKLGSLDDRSNAFHHLLTVLPKLKNIPEYIVLENVEGFEESDSYESLIKTLKDLNFNYQVN